MKAEALRVERLRVRQEGETLINDVSFAVYQGELLSVSGYYHAGKSVLTQALAGQLPLEGGRVIMPKNQRQRTHIACIHQNASVLNDYSIAENLFVFCRPQKRFLIPKKEIRNNTQRVLDSLGLSFSPQTPMSALSAAQQHLLQLVKAAWGGAAIVILDNVGVGYNAEEYAKLLESMRSFTQMTYLYMATQLDPIVEAADRVLCFREKRIGAMLFHGAFTQEDYDRAMNGIGPDAYEEALRPPTARNPRVALSLRPLREGQGIPIQVRESEIVGILDVYGSYWMRMARMLFDPKTYDICLAGRPVGGLDQALRRGMCIASMRSQEMVFYGMSLFDNVTMGIARRYARFGILNRRMLRYAYRQQLPDERWLLDVDGKRVSNRMLSLVRCAISSPKVLVLENLLFGLDERAKQQMYEKVLQTAKAGTGIILITSNAAECNALCSRTLVLRGVNAYEWR